MKYGNVKIASLELLSMQFPQEKQCRAASIFVLDIGKAICFNALLILQKNFFENHDKAKTFINRLKFSICLIQREIIYLMAKLRACFKWK